MSYKQWYMSLLSFIGLTLMLLGVLLPTLRFVLQKKGYRRRLIGDVVIGLFYLLWGLSLFFESWRYEQCGVAVSAITALAATNLYWIVIDLRH